MEIINQTKKTASGPFLIADGAGEGNRTPVATLGRLCSTIELHLQIQIIGVYIFSEETGNPKMKYKSHNADRIREECW